MAQQKKGASPGVPSEGEALKILEKVTAHVLSLAPAGLPDDPPFIQYDFSPNVSTQACYIVKPHVRAIVVFRPESVQEVE